jgi:hypothetical protein
VQQRWLRLADLFTADGEFSVSQQWGVAGARKIKGREALADAGGGDGKGGYDDVYVKTPAGWRFQSRIHIFPNLRESVQFGPRGRGAQPSAPPQPAGR